MNRSSWRLSILVLALSSAALLPAQTYEVLLKAAHGSAYTPPPCTPPGLFPDVPCPSGFADWIEQLYVEEITAGCAGPSLPSSRSSTAPAPPAEALCAGSL